MTRKDIIDTEARTPAENARTFLATLCVSFTATMVICMIFGTIFADEASKQGIMYCWSVLGACVCAAALQFVFFTPVVIKRMTYPLRLLLFGACLYVVLAVLAVTMNRDGWRLGVVHRDLSGHACGGNRRLRGQAQARGTHSQREAQ